ncbi:MAG TPA: site-2 protease family protein [Planctomycetota bacterium]|jgi:Zn-dependent protease|nr:site-2 protease family protein [Planctomycetota bacterium]
MDSPILKRCPECGADIVPGMLACPTCARLVHSKELKQLASDAEAAEGQGNLSAALSSWRSALELLPPESRQHESLLQKIRALSARVDDAPAVPQNTAWKKGAAGLSGLALLLFKFKAVLLFILTKGKFLLLGLTQGKTFFSMLLFLGVYWTIWGWKFALGFAVSIYIHEMGHVWMLNRYGIRATAPMFIPGFGALVRLQQYPVTVIEDARVGLAGPMWGLGAAAAAYAIYLLTGGTIWGALAQAGGFINLFNLIPIWQLDGGRGFRSLTRGQRALAAAAVGGMYWFTSSEGRSNMFLLIILACAFGRVFMGDAPKERDDFGLFQYVLLILLLGGLAAISLPGVH